MDSHPHVRDANPPLILIGRRKGALSAARKLGFKPVTIDVQARHEQSSIAFGGTAQWALEQAIQACQETPPIAVVAVATGAVMAAAAIREHFHLPGISTATAQRCHDKLVMKKAIEASGIPSAPWLETTANSTAEGLVHKLGLPLVLKLPISSGGRGVWICKSVPEISQHLRPGLLAEGFVEGLEMSVETFRINGRSVFQNPTAYLVPRIANVLPAALSTRELESIRKLSQQVHDCLEISSGISHMEIFLTPDGPVFGEIAARPPGGYLMELMHRAYQFDPWETLLQIALGKDPHFPKCASHHAGVWLLHPGQGTVEKVTGLESARTLPGIIDIICNLQPGEHLNERVGSGESVGRIFAGGSSYHSCATSLKAASHELTISVS
ncbi:ATP-grasp domain-containing protein [Verrucomicrobiaceae bacterium 227]